MKSIVVTSDKYVNLLNGFSLLFNKHWPGQDVVVLCYKPPKFSLPPNFSIISLGSNHDPYWTTGLIPYFQSLSDKYFALFLEDHFATRHVNMTILQMAINMIHENKVQKILLGEDACPNWHTYSKDFNIWNVIKKNRCLAPVSLEPSIWQKDLFLKFLKPNLTATEFETKNISEAISMGFTTLVANNPIYESIDAYRQGKFNPRIVERNKNIVMIAKKPHYISDDDLKIFLETKNDLLRTI